MELDFSQKLLNIKGKPIIENLVERDEDTNEVLKDEKGENITKVYIVTLEDVCINSLLANLDEKDKVSGKLKMERYSFAQRIVAAVQENNGVLEVKVEEVSQLKKYIAKTYNTAYMGAAWSMLDSAERPGKLKVAKKVKSKKLAK